MAATFLNKKTDFSSYGIFIWILSILFFLYEFFLRVLPATLSLSIVQGLNINIGQFAIIGSAYYLTYSLMQIPVGILLDRFSIRVLVTIASCLCSFGALWFAFSQDFTSAFIARFMIGIGSSFGFVGLMVITLNWFPKKHFAFMLGCGQFLGAIGPLVAGVPIALLLNFFNGDWRLIFLWTAIFGIILTVMIALFFRGKQKDPDAIVFIDRTTSIIKQIKKVLNKRQIWWTMFYASLLYVSLPLLGAFWGTAFLESKGFEKPTAALICSMIWIGLAVGCPFLGKLSEKYKRRVAFFALSAFAGLISSLLILFSSIENVYCLSFLFFLIGFAGSGQSLSFAVIAENAPKKLKATALGMNNTAIMGVASILPIFVTSIIQHYTVGDKITLLAFEKGLIVMPICFIIALIISLLAIKETFCRQQGEQHIINIRNR